MKKLSSGKEAMIDVMYYCEMLSKRAEDVVFLMKDRDNGMVADAGTRIMAFLVQAHAELVSVRSKLLEGVEKNDDETLMREVL